MSGQHGEERKNNPPGDARIGSVPDDTSHPDVLPGHAPNRTFRPNRYDGGIPASACLGASGVPEAELKLIFRGRIITERGKARCAAKEFGIEDGSALHVVGKPRPSKENEDECESEGGRRRNAGGEEGRGNSVEGNVSGSEEENSDNTEEGAVRLSDA